MQPIQFYRQFLHHPDALARGHSLIKDFLQAPQCRHFTLLNLFHDQVPILTLVANVYASEIFPNIPPQQKQSTREILMQQLAVLLQQEGPDSKKTRSLISFVGRIHNQDGYEEWTGMYEKIIQGLSGPNLSSFLVQTLQSADDRVWVLSTQLFKYVIENHVKLGMSPEKLLQILYLCARSFAHLKGTDDEVLNQYFTPYSSDLLSFAWNSLPGSLLARKHSLKLLTVLFTDLGASEDEPSRPYIAQLPDFAIQCCFEYLGEALTKQEGGRVQIDEDQEQATGQSLMGLIIYQFVELLDTLMTHYEQLNTKPILYLALLAATPTLGQWADWNSNSQEYILMSEDESETTLRNRCAQLLVSLLQDHPNQAAHRVAVINYLSAISGSVNQNSIEPLQTVIATDLNMKQISLPGPFRHYEQGAYYLLNSCLSNLFTDPKHIKMLKSSLMARVGQQVDSLVSIACLFVCISEPQPENSLDFCEYLIKLYSQHPGDPGILLIVSRGLGKCSMRNKLQIGTHIPLTFINAILQFLGRSEADDSAHIILELVVKLIDSSENNKIQLLRVIDPHAQLAMLNRYLHDGMIAAMVIDILHKIPHQSTVSTVAQSLMGGQVVDERISELIVKWAKSGQLQLNNEIIGNLLQVYSGPRQTTISNIVKYYLSTKCHDPASLQADSNLVALINLQPDSSWVIFMLRCNVLTNPQQLLLKNVHDLTYQVTSQHELQCKMILPFYVGLHHTKEFMDTLMPQGTLLQDFLLKLFRYAELFKGDHLRVVTALFFMKMTELWPQMKEKTLHLVDGYGKIEVDEWEEEEEDNQEALIEMMLGKGMLTNQQVEEELRDVFGELAWDSQRVKAMATELRRQ